MQASLVSQNYIPHANNNDGTSQRNLKGYGQEDNDTYVDYSD